MDLFVDPVCPFAWTALRWLTEVAVHRDLDLRVGQLSLAVLNEGPGGTPQPQGLDHPIRPARVGAALVARRGEEAWREFVVGYGSRYHEENVRPRDQVLRDVVDALASSADEAAKLYAAADDVAHDDAVRARHQVGVEPVGDEVGTPVLHVDGVAFFGPVLMSVPTGQLALDTFDGAVLLAGNPSFCELKRSRSVAA